jgi:hypothetical protein
MNQKERIERRNAIESELQYKLNYVIEKIKANGITDTGQAQNRYGVEVNRLLRAATEDAYQLGIEYVTSIKKTVGFLTQLDLDIIKEQVQKYSLKFWRKVDMVIHRNDVLLQKYNYEPRSELNTNYLATVVAVAVVTTTLAKATMQKARVLSPVKSAAIQKKLPKCPKGKHWDVKLKKCVDDETPPPSSMPFPPIPDLISPGLAAASFFLSEDEEGEYQTEDYVNERIVMVWNALLDNRTCAVCESLDGTVWDVLDVDAPIPGDEGDIHDNCRCWYDIETEELF